MSRRLGQLLRRGHQSLESLRLRLLPSEPRRHFVVVTAVRNGSAFIERCLASVNDQRYDHGRLRHIVIDDASDDDTADQVRRWQRTHPDHPLELWVNAERVGGCANYTRGFRMASPDSIVLQVDGDDWLPDGGVLVYLDQIYRDRGVWMTYNSWRFPDGGAALNSRPVPRDVIERNEVRSHDWTASHLHSFRSRLFAHVRDESLIDPQTGAHWTRSVDLSHYLPMLELAGHHARHLSRITYVYNLHDQSIFRADREAQRDDERRIRQLPRYQPLRRLA
ncbi:MAG: glycosyltransferase family 2 protein [Deltaproteobacteria bacterium]|nr:glycosyltransferase family 2 protein [Deltaproteobacteria bacterium]